MSNIMNIIMQYCSDNFPLIISAVIVGLVTIPLANHLKSRWIIDEKSLNNIIYKFKDSSKVEKFLLAPTSETKALALFKLIFDKISKILGSVVLGCLGLNLFNYIFNNYSLYGVNLYVIMAFIAITISILFILYYLFYLLFLFISSKYEINISENLPYSFKNELIFLKKVAKSEIYIKYVKIYTTMILLFCIPIIIWCIILFFYL